MFKYLVTAMYFAVAITGAYIAGEGRDVPISATTMIVVDPVGVRQNHHSHASNRTTHSAMK